MVKLKIPKENHLTNVKEDKYGYNKLSKAILDNVLNQMELPNCFGLYGNWGSGKSTVLHFIQEHLKGAQKKYEDIATVYFEPWKYEYAKENDLLFALLHKILDELGVSKKTTRRKLAKMLLTAASWGIKTLTLSGINPKEVAEDLTMYEDLLSDKYSDWVDQTENLKKEIQKTINQGLGKKKRLFIFIDDLDRCLPENAIHLLEGIKNFLSFESTLFVIAIDRRIVSEMIEQKYKLHKGYGSEYLMKIIHYYHQLPTVDPKETIQQIVDSYGITELSERMVGFMASFLRDFAGEPRRAKHFLHQFLMRITISNTLTSFKSSQDQDVEYDLKYLFVAGFLLERFSTVFASEDSDEKLRNLRDSALQSRKSDDTYRNFADRDTSISIRDRKIIEKILLIKVVKSGQSSNNSGGLDINNLGKMMRLLSTQ